MNMGVPMKYVSVELDVVLDENEDLDEAVASITKGFDVSGYVTTESGPGGGHPIVRITGPRDQVLALMHKGGYHDLEPYQRTLSL
jgi:hypothetical protein